MKNIFSEIKDRIDRELLKFIRDIDSLYSLSRISPLIFKSIKDFMLRDGKRVRPILFVTGYLGFADRAARGLYTSALSIELLHDFMLVHDDIIDKSDTRRGKPSMHRMLDNYLKDYKGIKFTGQDLAIVIGDIMYAMAIRAFLSIEENMERKERALKKFIEAAIYTGSGEFLELIYSVNDIAKINKEDVYKVYDYKTAHYTFTSPLSTGAILAGAGEKEVGILSGYGLCLGRAFQIKDDILGMFSEEQEIGKSAITDLKEAKKTVLIWHAYNNADAKNKSRIKRILSKKKVNREDLMAMRSAIVESGSLSYVQKEIALLLKKSQSIISSSGIKPQYKEILHNYAREILAP
ncbi:MAG: polyprenyl synthetase family protein [Candidatus Omnitrophica bacterium]|nr:polyprenyl synthetase family protein [Candidatus Omnitrophota bacterium]